MDQQSVVRSHHDLFKEVWVLSRSCLWGTKFLCETKISFPCEKELKTVFAGLYGKGILLILKGIARLLTKVCTIFHPVSVCHRNCASFGHYHGCGVIRKWPIVPSSTKQTDGFWTQPSGPQETSPVVSKLFPNSASCLRFLPSEPESQDPLQALHLPNSWGKSQSWVPARTWALQLLHTPPCYLGFPIPFLGSSAPNVPHPPNHQALFS